MTDQLLISLSNTIESVMILDNCPASIESGSQLDRRGNDLPEQIQDNSGPSDTQQATFFNACRALNNAADKLHKLYEQTVTQQRAEIAKLATEIAGKILRHKIEKKDYEITSIIEDILKKSPSNQDIVIHLNPDDLAQCKKVIEKETKEVLDGIKLVADSNVGHAECILKSPKGIISSLIHEHLEQISEALGKV